MASSSTPVPQRWWEIADPAEALVAYTRQANSLYNRTKVRLFEGLLGDLSGKTVLDYGGGGGFMTLLSVQRGAQRVVLVEPGAVALRLARYQIERAGVTDRVTTIQSDRVPDSLAGQRFDVVLLKDVVEHVPDDVGLLRGLAALQPPGGRLLLSTPNRLSLNFLLEGAYQRWREGNRAWLGWDSSHVRMHTPWSLRRTLRSAGYRPTRWRGLYIIPYDIPSWLVLLRRKIVWPALHRFDLWAGGVFPFSRCGWNVVLVAERVGAA